MADYDVIVAGLGPVGATLCALLGEQGLKVAVVEIHAKPFDKPRAIVLDHEALRTFQFCRIDPAFYRGINPHPGTDFLGVDGELIKLFDPAPAPFPLDWPPTVTFIQPELEAALRARLAALPNVTLETGARVAGFTQDADGVAVEIRPEDGGPGRTLTARWLVGCDGTNSVVRQAAGMEFYDLQFDEYWVVVDAWLKRDVPLRPKVTQYCRPERPGTLVIGPDTLRRWEIKLLPGEDPAAFQDEGAVRALLAGFVDVDALDIWRSAAYRFSARVADDWRNGRVLIAGDAAHQMPPFLGQGLCAGIRDAVNLAWKLVQVERLGAPPVLLDSYAQERRPHVGTVIAHAKDFGLIIGELDADRAAIRDVELRRAMASGEMKTIRQAFIPDLEHGLIDSRSKPVAGSLFPQPRVLDGQGAEHLLEDMLPYRFLLLSAGSLPADMHACWARTGGILLELSDDGDQLLVGPTGQCLRDPSRMLARWLEARGGLSAIVRPDRYVYGVAGDAGALDRMLADLLPQIGVETVASS